MVILTMTSRRRFAAQTWSCSACRWVAQANPRRCGRVSLCGKRGGRSEPAWPSCRPCGSRRRDCGTPLLGRRKHFSLYPLAGVPHQFLDDLYPQLRGALAEGAQLLSLCKGLHLEGNEIVPLTGRISAQTGYATSILAGPNLYTEMARDG